MLVMMMMMTMHGRNGESARCRADMENVQFFRSLV